MNWKAKYPACILILYLVVSCEEIIELDLGSSAPKIVVEAIVTTDPGPYRVRVSQSIDYQEPNDFPPVSGASITITDKGGYTEILKETAGGIYETSGLQGKHGEPYLLEVAYMGKIYSASSTIPETRIPIHSISYQYAEESIFNEEGYYMVVYFNDPAHEVNYYRLKVFVNGDPYFFEVNDNLVKDDNFWLINDKFFDGQMMDYEFPHKLEPGDKVDIELHQVDQATYDYYRTLVELMGVGGVAPSNPLTNWTNGAMGYFGAVSITYASVVIEVE